MNASKRCLHQVMILVLLGGLGVNSGIGQVQNPRPVKHSFDQELSGECIVKGANLSVIDQSVSKTFEIDILKSDVFFINAWALGVKSKSGLLDIKVYMDDENQPIGQLQIEAPGWQPAMVVDIKDGLTLEGVPLTAGLHSIRFETQAPEVPMVDFIRLGTTMQEAELSDKPYKNYIDVLKSSALPDNYEEKIQDSSRTSLQKVIPNPNSDYLHEIDITGGPHPLDTFS